MPARLLLEEPRRRGGELRIAATLQYPDAPEQRLWWQVPEAWAEAVTLWADPLVVGLMFPMMQRGGEMRIEGRASPSLLANLELFARVWHVWRPERYKPVTLSATDEQELPVPADPSLAAASFSCGVDSCYTVYRHSQGLLGRRSRRIGAAVLQEGFDARLDDPDRKQVFAGLLARAHAMLGSLDIPCIPLLTNFQELKVVWADAWGTQLVSGLMVVSRRFGTGLVANDLPFSRLGYPWACHPLTNPFLGSSRFPILDDGGEAIRYQKAKVISDWPAAMRHLHVCFGTRIPGSSENCCQCEKCIRTMLAFRVAGCPRPEAFARDATDRQVREASFDGKPTVRARWAELAKAADGAGMGATRWAKAMKVALRRNTRRERRARMQKPFIPLRNMVRRCLRGSALSRSQAAAQARAVAAKSGKLE